MKTAILIDGGFYRRRAQSLYGEKTAEERANELETYCRRHINERHEDRKLYRIFYYDCPPINKKVFHPFLNNQIDLGKSDLYKWTDIFLSELKKKRKFALRLGRLSEEQASYVINPALSKKLTNGSLKIEDLTERDYILNVTQKGVDMKIGIDIASLALKKQVEQIILISGDSDFVPALKLARREGVDIVLDPMRSPIKDDLFEHIDGIRTQVRKNDSLISSTQKQTTKQSS